MGHYAAIKSDIQRNVYGMADVVYVKELVIWVGDLSPHLVWEKVWVKSTELNQLQVVGIWGFYFSPMCALICSIFSFVRSKVYLKDKSPKLTFSRELNTI